MSSYYSSRITTIESRASRLRGARAAERERAKEPVSAKTSYDWTSTNGRTSSYETNSNHNNNSLSNGVEKSPYASRYSADGMTRKSGFRNSRTKQQTSRGSLVSSMAANFEKKQEEPPATPVQNGISQQNGSSKPQTNGYGHKPDVKVIPSIEIEESPEHIEKPKIVPEETEEVSPRSPKKSNSSARRGKAQREKRMLRQKRRSTGVVRLDDNEDDANNNKKNEDVFDDVTKDNTVNNELSPISKTDPVRSSSNSLEVDSYDRFTTSTYSSQSKTTNYRDTNSVTNGIDSPTINVPQLNSSRRRGIRSPVNSDSDAMAELQEKLSKAELTITKLKKEIESMDKEMANLEEENSNLKEENKMLSDENIAMLRLFKTK